MNVLPDAVCLEALHYRFANQRAVITDDAGFSLDINEFDKKEGGKHMQAGKDLIGKPIFSISDGRQLGTVKDFYLDSDLNLVTGVYLGPQGLFSRKSMLIERNNVMVFGVDAILAKHSDAVTDSSKAAEWTRWVRRDRLQGRPVATAGGTKVGIIDDVILDEAMRILGFRLWRVFIEGPVAERRAVVREAVIEPGGEDDVMLIDLSKAERQSLKSR